MQTKEKPTVDSTALGVCFIQPLLGQQCAIRVVCLLEPNWYISMEA